jgi:hypothetical protein
MSAFLKILMAARWSAILFASFFGTPYPHDSGTTSITCPVYFQQGVLRQGMGGVVLKIEPL